MSLDKIVEDIKGRSGFTENVGLLLLHNEVVRADLHEGQIIRGAEVFANELKIGEICQAVGSMRGIFAVTAESKQGMLKAGDDMLYLAVAGDSYKNILPAFETLLERVKNETIEIRYIV